MSDLIVDNVLGEYESLGDYAGDLEGALADLSGVSEPVSVMDLVRDPRRLSRVGKAALLARNRARDMARKHKEAGNASRAALSGRVAAHHHAMLSMVSTIAAHHAQERLARQKRANYAVGILLSAAGGGSAAAPVATDTASITSPTSDAPWQIVSFMADPAQAVNFVILSLLPANSADLVVANGVSYATTTVTPSIPLTLWTTNNFAINSPTHQLAPWQRGEGWGFGPAAVVKLKLGNIDPASAHSIALTMLGRCVNPCRENPAEARDGFARLKQSFYSGSHWL